MSTLMFWNKQNNNNNNNNNNSNINNAGGNNQSNDMKSGKRVWLHAPDILINGHVVYLVKFLGNTLVDQPKGIDVVKDAIRRLQFAQEMKKAETGSQLKMQKLEITISVDGVAVQEPRTQKILHQFPLHNISYCADEKGVKKFFSFIAKHTANSLPNGTQSSNNSNNSSRGESSTESHECFVFVSSKLASDITLTIGQAFDLAYRRYMNDNEKATEMSKVQAQNKELEAVVSLYKNRLKDISEMLPKSDLDRFLKRLEIQSILDVPKNNRFSQNSNISEPENDNKLLLDTTTKNVLPTVPPRTLQNQINSTLDSFISSSQKMGELLLNSDSDSDFDPRAEEAVNGNKVTNDLFGFEPSMNNSIGTHSFTNNLHNNINNLNNNNILNLNNGINETMGHLPPLLAPPPVKSRRSAGSTQNGGTQDLFGSIPFSANHPPSILDEKFNKSDALLNDFTLESLDPLRK